MTQYVYNEWDMNTPNKECNLAMRQQQQTGKNMQLDDLCGIRHTGTIEGQLHFPFTFCDIR
jgi:hypothetical protein